jgi:hypothetical protein
MNDKRLTKSVRLQRTVNVDLKAGIESKTLPVKAPPIEYDNKWVEIHRENVKLRERLQNLVNPKKPLAARIRDTVVQLGNLPTGWLAAWDDSFVGRQGLKMLAHQPKAWATGTKASLQAMRSEALAWTVDATIHENPHFALAQRSKLEYTELESTARLASAEEAVMPLRVAEKIPLLGKGLRPFDRAYTTAANVMRHDAFYRMADAMGDKWGAEQYKAYAGFLNKLTGRGDLGRLSALQPDLNAIFISPRKIAADIQLLTTPFTGPKEVRLVAARTLVQYTAALGTLALVVNASGKAKIGLDPNSPDFLKLRKGDTRFDLTGGQSTVFRTAWKIGQAAFAYSKWGKAKFGTRTPTDVAKQYLRGKMSPGLSFGTEMITGKDFKGDAITPGKAALGLVTPWNLDGMIEAWKTDGAGMGVVAGISDFWGIGTQSYKDTPKKAKKPTLLRRRPTRSKL